MLEIIAVDISDECKKQNQQVKRSHVIFEISLRSCILIFDNFIIFPLIDTCDNENKKFKPRKSTMEVVREYYHAKIRFGANETT
jgi:hypothetical protein